MSMVSEPSIRVTAVFSPCAGQVLEETLNLPTGSTLGRAIEASGFLRRWPELMGTPVRCGVWGRTLGHDHPLRSGDRVEFYRALTVDPKTARRERFSRQGARSAGLFARPETAPKARR